MALWSFTNLPSCVQLGLCTIRSDPHFYGFEGDQFNLHGEPGKCYNLLSDKDVQINALFRDWPTTPGGTVMQKIAIKLAPSLLRYPYSASKTPIGIIIDATDEDDCTNLYLLDKGSSDDDLYKNTEDKKAAGEISDFIKAYTLVLPHYKFMFPVETDRVNEPYLNILAELRSDTVRPHGIIGQTADFDFLARMGEGPQGEGAIEGVYTDYEVSNLLADDFKYNRFMQ
jgi:hypothetical protein